MGNTKSAVISIIGIFDFKNFSVAYKKEKNWWKPKDTIFTMLNWQWIMTIISSHCLGYFLYFHVSNGGFFMCTKHWYLLLVVSTIGKWPSFNLIARFNQIIKNMGFYLALLHFGWIFPVRFPSRNCAQSEQLRYWKNY